ncbi:MAG TPA: threonine--tRNA ligase, partial [Thauera sp.]|nr:threonine--tRNA ligase [Thauera sp.]
AFIRLLQEVYADFGFTDVLVKLSTRPEKRVGTDEQWDAAEAALAAALEAQSLEYELQPGEGAFYGPKIEFSLKDSLGRVWQCGTLQLDFNLPVRLGAEYVDEDNTKKVPVMLHRAVLGSLERFIGILIENHAGAMPLWLAPVQAVVANISEGQADYAADVVKKLRKAGFRVEADLRNEKINYKIREHSVQKLPYQIVIGDKEKAAGLVAVRARGGQDLGQMSLDSLIERWRREIEAKAGSV